MTTDMEQLLQESMAQLAAVTTAPPGLVGRARRRLRRRRLAMISAAAGAAAAITAVAVATATGAGSPASTVSRAQTTAYVISRVENALAGENFVIQGRASGIMSGSVHGHRYRYSGGATDSWSFGMRNRMEEFTGRNCGHVDSNGWCTHRGGSVRYLADGTALIRGKLVSAYITYYDHRYSLSPLGHYQLKPCSKTAQVALGGPAVSVPNWPALIKTMLRCNRATVTGHARIGKVPVIVISGSIDIPLPKGYGRSVRETRVRVGYTLYVDAKTYLPMRAYGSTKTYGGAGGPTISSYVTNVRWLSPTPANKAKALVTIPHGYTQWTGSRGNQ